MPRTPKPPVAEQRPLAVTRHGETVEDPYAWLRAENWQEVTREPDKLDPAIRDYLEAENKYAEAALKPVAKLRRTLYAELKGRIKEDDATVPAPDGAFEYYLRYETGGQHPIFCRRPTGIVEAERVLLDGNKEAEGHPYFRVAACEHDFGHTHLAYAVDLTGSEHYTVRIKEIESGRVLEDRIEGTAGSVVWAGDGRTLFYSRLDENLRPSMVFRHRMGSDPADDVLVYEERDPKFFVRIDATADRRFVIIHMSDHSDTSEVRLIDMDAPHGAPVVFAERAPGVSYSVASHGARFFVLTNDDDAVDFKIAETPLDKTAREHWRDLLPHEEGRLIRDVAVFAGHMARLERVDGLPRIVIRRLADGAEHAIAFDEAAYDLGLYHGYEFDTAGLRFDYSSLATPARVYDYDMETRDRTLRKEQEVPSGHDPADYLTGRIMAKAADGEAVPVSILHHKDTALDGSAPLLLYGYGSYGYAMDAAFGTSRLSLVDRGFVYAIAHIRGGTDRGYRWYLDGKMAKKMNTFTDFIAAAEGLIADGYTAAGRIVAHGGSAGGLLVGAAANMRPELFAAIVAEVPFVDVVNTIADASLPLTPPEWDEWGNPIEDAAAYRTIKSYSPYDNVEAKAYPAMMVTAGVSDPRVTYWEPAKWVARLRALKTDDKLVILRTNMEAGHGGASGRFERLEEIARIYAFILMVCDKAG
jgi:oligopeptidase B